MSVINFNEKFGKIDKFWDPKIIARLNDYHFKLAKISGRFDWHKHEETDEVFLVLQGQMDIHYREGAVTVRAGEMIVVPKGREHMPSAEHECRIMLVEPAGTLNTGDVRNERTIENTEWI